MMRQKFENIPFIAARLFIGGLFIYAGVPKIINPQGFAQAIYSYQILPDFIIHPAAVILPWVETVTGGFLVAGIWVSGAALLANLMLYVFTAALMITLFRGIDIDCGCFAAAGAEIINPATIARDIVFLLVAGYVFIKSLKIETDL